MIRKGLQGVGVALATPFHKNGQIDFSALEKLVQHTIDGGVDFLVVLGTTGETPCLTTKEKYAVVESVIEHNNKRLPIMVGVGGNSTSEIVEKLDDSILASVDAVLNVVPYYNKPSQEGLFRHYQMIGERSQVPVIAYNVPARTGVNMSADTLLRIAKEVPNIIGVKEASGNVSQIMSILSNRPQGFKVFSGDDALSYVIRTLGGDGLISTTANLLPASFKKIIHGEPEQALEEQFRLLPLIDLLFREGSPSGLKAALELSGLCRNAVRLPLTKVSKSLSSLIDKELKLLL